MKLEFDLDEKTIMDTLDIWPREYMTCVHMEEYSEVVQAVSKIERMKKEGGDNYDLLSVVSKLEEELADTLICMSNMIMMGLVDEKHIQAWIQMKQDRQRYRNDERRRRIS